METLENNLENCPIRDVLHRVSDRWSMLIILHLEGGTLRFSEIKRCIPDISQRMLSQTLRRLELDGLVERRVYPVVPQRVEYELSALGHSLLVPFHLMKDWAEANHAAIRQSRSAGRPSTRY
ncbi:winged helix-turn-helix transcriptional regulator [Rhizobium sp. SL86]|uniref:winged helix-turn-helix transcriptional regulator n=1 Tax=Rhizobium sp. SL86 TaxID=2995148 RepID=UPI0022731D46|nr:helix-turn-helix domain-containing protein [Rhizobium sp. SL86]MCY1668052.1 helix-turn-helix domain-containing protein [Rhizobium sp. SL86]